jgi:hypothetical protein
MRQINCYIPITVRVRGRLSDAQLDEFCEKLTPAVAARITAAQRLMAERFGRYAYSRQTTNEHGSWNPTQADAAGRYEIASYQGSPKTRVKIDQAATTPQGRCRTGHVLGQGEFVPKDEGGGNDLLYYRMWGTWKTSDTGLNTFAERVVNAWIRWRFGPLAPEDRHKVSDFLFTSVLSKLEGGVGVDGCDYAIVLSKPVHNKAVELSGEIRRAAELRRVRAELEAKPGETPDYAKATVDQRLVLLENRIRVFWTGNKDEQAILDILRSTPDDQAAELSRRLSTDRYGDETYFAALDRVVDLGNNLELHVELTKLHLRGLGGAKGVRSILEDAPVLPWHDVMGFGHDVPVTFSATSGPSGSIVIQYHRGYSLFGTDMPFQSELDALPFAMKIGGRAFDPDQLFKVHDWDESKFVIVRARDLLAYQNIGIRNWLGHMATVASFALPGGAATTAAGKVALIVIERAIPLFVLAVRENRLSLVEWFPTWGPRMIYFADVAELAIGVYGLANVVRSGVKFFNAWREARFARKLWEAAESLDDAEKAAVRIESEADKVLNAVDEFQQAESVAGRVKPPGPPPVELPTGPPAPKSVATGASAEGRAAAAKSANSLARDEARAAVRRIAPKGISEETVSMLEKNPELLEALRKNPRAARALTLCKSLCIPEFASPEQVGRIERVLKEAEVRGIKINQTDLKNFLHEARDSAELSKAISRVEVAVRSTGELREALSSSRAYWRLFQGLGRRLTTAQKARLMKILDRAEEAGIYLSERQLDELSMRLKSTRVSEMEQEIEGLEKDLDRAIGVKREGGAAAEIGRTADLPEQLPEGTQASGTTTKPRTATLSDAELLAAQLTKTIGPRPPGHEAHHIVPKGMKEAEEAREILRKADIGINDVENGIWLPKDTAVVNEFTSDVHSKVHTTRVIRVITEQLREGAKGGPEGVRRALRMIQRTLSDLKL